MEIHKGKVAPYENFALLIELVGEFLLPSGPTKPLRILLDLGATNNFINQRTVDKNGIKRSKLTLVASETIKVGDSGTTRALGETQPIMMRNGEFKHSSTFTILELGSYDVVLGMPFINHHQAHIEGGEMNRVTVVTPHGRRSLPLRATNAQGVELHWIESPSRFLKGIDQDELYQVQFDPRKGPVGGFAEFDSGTKMKYEWGEETQGGKLEEPTAHCDVPKTQKKNKKEEKRKIAQELNELISSLSKSKTLEKTGKTSPEGENQKKVPFRKCINPKCDKPADPHICPKTGEPKKACSMECYQAWKAGLKAPEEQKEASQRFSEKREIDEKGRMVNHKDPGGSILKDLQRPSGDGRLERILERHMDVFPEDLPTDLPVEREIAMRIPVKEGMSPPSQAPYRVSEDAKKAIEATLSYLYEHKFARDSISEYASPVTLAKKADGTWRFCVDYRKLNAITKEAKYPLPRIEDCLDQLRGATWFSKLDLRSGYWQLRVHPEDVEKTAFRTHMGHHEFLIMPFGLQGAPSCFQRLMNHYLRPYLGKFCMVYLDDILIYSRTKEEHYQHLEMILKLLQEKKLYAKASKCDLFKQKVGFLGYIVEGGEISVDPGKIKAINEWPEPKTVRQVRSFLGLCNFYRKFIEKFSEKAKPLTNILKSTEFEEKFGRKFAKLAPVEFGEPERTSFKLLKEVLTSAPCLVIYDPDKETEVWADASWENQTVGAVLLQNHGKGLQPVAYMSKVMNRAQAKYPTFEQELLALKLAFEEWKHYLLPLVFKARTDHNGLKYLKTQKHLSERQWHWLGFLSEFNFELIYKPGTQMKVPDALSRKPHTKEELQDLLRVCSEEETKFGIAIPLNDGVTKVFLNLEQVRQEGRTFLKFDYRRDRDFGEIYQTLKNNPEAVLTRPSLQLYGIDKNNQLVWLDKSQHTRVCVPSKYRVDLVKEYHDTPIGGHFGPEKTYESLRKNFYWPHMKTLIEKYISTCDLCQKHKNWTRKRYREPIIPEAPLEPWTEVSIDFCGPFPKTKRGHDYVCAVTCTLIKETLLIPCSKTITAAGTAQLYKEHVFRYKGLPERIISDRGPQFVANFWKNLWGILGTKVTLTAPYHPQSNPVERQNKTFQEGLRSFVNARQDDWDEVLILFEFALNDTVNPSTGQTPFFLNCGRHPRIPTTQGGISSQPAVTDFVQTLQNNLAAARDSLLKSKAYNADYQKSDYQAPEFKAGDLVLLDTKNLNLQLPSKKLQPLWIGPLKVLQTRGPNTVLVEIPPRLSRLEPTQNVQYLKKYNVRPPELGPQTIPLPPELVGEDEEYEVEEIISHRLVNKRMQYLVRFKSYGPEEDLWLPLKNLTNAPDILKRYHERQNLDPPRI